MERLLSCVIRFTTNKDLCRQLDSLEASDDGAIELLCIGCGTEEDFDEAKDAHGAIDNASFHFTGPDYANARTQAIYLAKGAYVLFASMNYKYKWANILSALEKASQDDLGIVILRSNNRNRIPNRKKSPKPAIVSMDENPENYFQILGCTLSYTAVSKELLEQMSSMPDAERVHDNALIAQIACSGNPVYICGSKDNGALKNEVDDDKKADVVYDDVCPATSMILLISLRDSIREKANRSLNDSFNRLYSSRIRTYLIQNREYAIRKPVLELISNDELTVEFFRQDTPDWPKASKKCFEFAKTAIASYLKAPLLSGENVRGAEVSVAAKCKDPKVSMICPVYNSSDYLKRTIESALSQTFESFEVICINDGSTDDSLAVLEQMASDDDRLTICSQVNMGQSVARNNGIAHARGEYVYFFDSDDLLEPDLLKNCMQAIKEHDLDIVLFDAATFYESGNVAQEHDSFDRYYGRSREYDEVVSGSELMAEMHAQGDYKVSPCMYVFRKSIMTDNDITFIPGVIHEDNAFTFELMNCAQRASHIKEPLYLRRVHEGSVMTTSKTFNNAYGYFKCAVKLLSQRFNTLPEQRALALELAVKLSYTMLKLAQRDLLDAPDGQEGGAYAFADMELRLFMLLVLDTERPTRKFDEEAERADSLKAELAEAKARISELEKQLSAQDQADCTPSASKEAPERPKEKRQGLFSSRIKKR